MFFLVGGSLVRASVITDTDVFPLNLVLKRFVMNNISFLLAMTSIGILSLSIGCSRSEQTGAKPEETNAKAENKPEFKTLTQVTSKDRNSVHVALWTIKNSDIKVSDEIDFDLPYKDNSPALESVAAELDKLDFADRRILDESLAHHWQIYSPIWGPDTANWE